MKTKIIEVLLIVVIMLSIIWIINFIHVKKDSNIQLIPIEKYQKECKGMTFDQRGYYCGSAGLYY